jgi:hypothetical protein
MAGIAVAAAVSVEGALPDSPQEERHTAETSSNEIMDRIIYCDLSPKLSQWLAAFGRHRKFAPLCLFPFRMFPFTLAPERFSKGQTGRSTAASASGW